MAVYGSYVSFNSSQSKKYIRSYLSYSVSSTDDTSVTYAIKGGCDLLSNYHTSAKIKDTLSGTGQTTASSTVDNKNYGGGSHTIISKSWKWTRTNADENKTISNKIYHSGTGHSSEAKATITIPATPSVTFNFDANYPGAPSIPSVTGNYNYNITLPLLTRDGEYNLMGWFSTASGTGTNYGSGGSSYKVTETSGPVTMYARWSLTWISGYMSNVTFTRCTLTGTPSKSGAYTKVTGECVVAKEGTTLKPETMTVYTKESEAGSWITAKTATISTNSTFSYIVSTPDASKNYDIKIAMTNEYDNVVKEGQIFAYVPNEYPLVVRNDVELLEFRNHGLDNTDEKVTSGIYLNKSYDIDESMDIFLGMGSTTKDTNLSNAITAFGWDSECILPDLSTTSTTGFMMDKEGELFSFGKHLQNTTQTKKGLYFPVTNSSDTPDIYLDLSSTAQEDVELQNTLDALGWTADVTETWNENTSYRTTGQISIQKTGNAIIIGKNTPIQTGKNGIVLGKSNIAATDVIFDLYENNILDNKIIETIEGLKISEELEPGSAPTYATYLYSDGTLIINEPSNMHFSNIRVHGSIIGSYPEYSADTTWTTTSNIPWQSAGKASAIKVVEFGATVQPTAMSYWFSGCTNLEELNTNNIDFSLCTTMQNMCYNCRKLVSFDLSGTTFTALTNTASMFYGCTLLETITCDVDLSALSTLTSHTNMFYNCNAIRGVYLEGETEVAVTTYNSSYINKSYARPRTTSVAGYFTSGGDAIS